MYKLKRNELNLLSTHLDIDFKLIKTKKELIKKIKTVEFFERYLKCYNTNDMLTLEPIHLIPKSEYIQWKQHSYTFGSSMQSINALIERNLFDNPYKVDLPDEDQRLDFDLRNVPKLVIDCRYTEWDATTSVHNQFIFEIDALCESHAGYISGKITTLILREIRVDRIIARMYESICRVWDLITYERGDLEMQDIYENFILVRYEVYGSIITHKIDQLRFILDMFKDFKDILGEKAIYITFTIFNDLQVLI